MRNKLLTATVTFFAASALLAGPAAATTEHVATTKNVSCAKAKQQLARIENANISGKKLNQAKIKVTKACKSGQVPEGSFSGVSEGILAESRAQTETMRRGYEQRTAEYAARSLAASANSASAALIAKATKKEAEAAYQLCGVASGPTREACIVATLPLVATFLTAQKTANLYSGEALGAARTAAENGWYTMTLNRGNYDVEHAVAAEEGFEKRLSAVTKKSKQSLLANYSRALSTYKELATTGPELQNQYYAATAKFDITIVDLVEALGDAADASWVKDVQKLNCSSPKYPEWTPLYAATCTYDALKTVEEAAGAKAAVETAAAAMKAAREELGVIGRNPARKAYLEARVEVEFYEAALKKIGVTM